MFSSPNSFSMTAIFWPWASVRMRLSSVVLPEPRKPVRMVAGMRPLAAVVEEADMVRESVWGPADGAQGPDCKRPVKSIGYSVPNLHNLMPLP